MMKNKLVHFISYVLVGGIATIVEWGCYYLFDPVLHINTYVAIALAFIVSTFANWLAGRLMTFRNAEKKNIVKELLEIYGVSVIGLLMNEAIMLLFMSFIFKDASSLQRMIAKVIATGVVFFWNYLIRTFVIYRKKTTKEDETTKG